VLVNTARKSDNFIVGLTNVSPLISTPTLWNYTLCGQYPGAVPAAATVSVVCPYGLPPFRYVIVQFPITDQMNICELEVITPGTCLSNMISTLVGLFCSFTGRNDVSLSFCLWACLHCLRS